MKELDIIKSVYGDSKAQRSGVLLMNHIIEGLEILEKIGAEEDAKKAYCLHPILQSDEALTNNWNTTDLNGIPIKIIILVMEYRKVANAYLSLRKIKSLKDIELSPLQEVNQMLYADKIQNRKDFLLYHYRKHARSTQLFIYFNNWIKKLESHLKLNPWTS